MFLSGDALFTLAKIKMNWMLTCYLSDHGLRDPSVCQEGLNLLFDHSTVPSEERGSNVYTEDNKYLNIQSLNRVCHD